MATRVISIAAIALLMLAAAFGEHPGRLLGGRVPLSSVAMAAPLPAVSLANCQKVMRSAAFTYEKKKEKAISACLQAISKRLVAKQELDASSAAALCVAQFRKLEDTRPKGKSLRSRFLTAATKACDPAVNPKLTHTPADVLGTGSTLPEPIDAKRIGEWCVRYGGTGTIAALGDWMQCVVAAADCNVETGILVEYPRALEWFAMIRGAMLAIAPPTRDLTKIADAVAALDAVRVRIDGSDNDGLPSLACGPFFDQSRCLSETSECQAELPACGADLADCYVGKPYPARPKASPQYLDNGNGTISDLATGLTWEKLCTATPPGSPCPSEHDVGSVYTWDEARAKILGMNQAGYSGHNDWRVPNLQELFSIVDLTRYNPAVDPIFNSSCLVPCGPTSCSCTSVAHNYWTSNRRDDTGYVGWNVNFLDGEVEMYLCLDEDSTFNEKRGVRAVRSGL